MNTLSKKMIVTGILFGILSVYACNETKDETEDIEIVVATVSATPENITLAVGEIRAVKAVVTPDGANQAIYWKSADHNIATVTNGIVTGIAEGETVVTVNSIADASKKDEVTVRVVAASVPVESISLEVESREIYIGDEIPIRAIIEPDNATNREILWQNSNPEVADIIEVEGNRMVRGLARGKARFTVLAGMNTNLTSSVEITVTDRSVPVESISISHTDVAMAAGTTKTITSTVAPDDATIKTLLWESSNSAVATVSDGVITAHSSGTAVVTVKSESNPEITATVTVDVPDLSALSPLFVEVAGLWLFDDSQNITKATIGNRLGMKGGNPIVPINGIAAVTVPKGSYFEAYHDIAPNGGGNSVNEYTLMADFRIPATGAWYTFFQTNLANSEDGECFIKTNNTIGIAAPGYSTATVEASKWYRLVVAFKGGILYDIYLDGVNIFTTAGDNLGSVGIDSKFSLSPEGIILFGDNDGDDSNIDVSGIAIWGRTLNASEINSLGTATTP
jgi:uncharacterized protein YjdB